jgi:hypothetical protein
MEYYRNKSQSCESERLSEDEAIAIKGKFRQIGHSVLATALMKKMTKKQVKNKLWSKTWHWTCMEHPFDFNKPILKPKYL